VVRLPDGGRRRAHRHRDERQAGAGSPRHNRCHARRTRFPGVEEQRGGHVPDSSQQAVAAAQAHGAAEPHATPELDLAASADRFRPETHQDQVPVVRHNVSTGTTTADAPSSESPHCTTTPSPHHDP